MLPMTNAYRDLINVGGETFAISHGGNAARLRGMYDRRVFFAEIGGAEVRQPDYRVGVSSEDLPDWVAVNARIDIRADALQVTAIEPDGQGLTYLVCRPAV